MDCMEKIIDVGQKISSIQEFSKFPNFSIRLLIVNKKNVRLKII